MNWAEKQTYSGTIQQKSVLLLLVEEMLGFLLQRLELLLLAVVQHVLFFLRQVLADLFISSV